MTSVLVSFSLFKIDFQLIDPFLTLGPFGYDDVVDIVFKAIA